MLTPHPSGFLEFTGSYSDLQRALKQELQEIIFTVQAITEHGGIPSGNFESRARKIIESLKFYELLQKIGYKIAGYHWNEDRGCEFFGEKTTSSQVNYRDGKIVIFPHFCDALAAGDLLELHKAGIYPSRVFFRKGRAIAYKLQGERAIPGWRNEVVVIYAKNQPLVSVASEFKQVKLKDGIAWISPEILQQLQRST